MDETGMNSLEFDDSKVALESIYSAWKGTSEAVRTTREPAALYRRVCDILVKEGLCTMAWIGQVNPEDQVIHPVASAGRDEGFLQSSRHSAMEIPAGLGPTGVAVRTALPDVVDDVRTEVRMGPWQAEALRREYFSCAAFPIKLEDGVTAVLTIYADEPGFFDYSLARMLELFANNVSLAIEALAKEARSLEAQESLRRSEVYYRTIIENSQDIITVLDAAGSITYMSPSAQSVLGYGRWELRNRNIFELFHPDDVQRVKHFHARVIAQPGVSDRTEGRFRHTDGSYVDLDVSGRSFGQGSDLNVIINARDITDRKVVEEAQKKDRDFISAVLDTTTALVVVFDQTGRIILFNKTAEQATGYPVEEVRGRTPEFLVLPGELNDFYRTFRGFVEGHSDRQSFEGRIVTRQGATRLIAWSNTGVDITEQREAESAVKESEERYRTIFESTGTAMCLVRDDGTLEFQNQEFERMTGYSAEQVEGSRRFADFLATDDVVGFERYHGDTRRGLLTGPVHFECRIVDRSGKAINVLANMGLLPGSASSVLSLIDVTREREYEAELAERAERLKHFLTVASHELRHPITIVKGYANTLNAFMDDMSQEHIHEILRDINASTDRLTRYVEELMDVSMVEEGRLVVETDYADTNEMVRLALEDMSAIGAENDFKSYVAPEAASVKVDAEKFLQVLIILVENAVKFSPKGSPVEVAIGRNGTWVEGVVLDRGRGISAEDRVRVFDRFFQVEDTMHHSTPGMGLGLYIAREIIAAHGGSISCEERPGGGSTFRFKLPAGEEKEAETIPAE
jgi:PAS domain S-box-containing protein